MREDVIARQTAAMREHGLDAILSSSPENFAYVTGFLSPTQSLMRWRHAMALVTRDGACALLVVDMEASTISAKAPPKTEIAVWAEFSFNAIHELAGLLGRHGLATSRIGVETDYLPAADYLELRSRLPKVNLTPVQSVLARLRQVKMPDEIKLLQRLSQIADTAITDSFDAVHAGMTEMDIAGALTKSVYAHGAEYFRLMIVATGERSVFPNVGPTDRVLRRGDICRVEIFPMIAGYHAGVCRTAAVQTPPPEAERVWEKLVECKYMLLDAIKPGASSRSVYDRYIQKVGELGLPPISFIGHGIGLHLHEDPYLSATGDQPLEAGMVLGIEPLIYETGFGFGMQNKDMIVVTDSGCSLLSNYADTDKLLIVS